MNRVVTKTLVGPTLCTSTEWMDATMGYTTSAFQISSTLRPQSRFVRPFKYYFMKARRECRKHLQAAHQLLKPLIEQRRRGDNNPDLLQWLIDDAKGTDQDSWRLTNKILFMSLAAVNASNMGVVHALFDLCDRPQDQDVLRREVEDAVNKAEGWGLTAIKNMDRLDSFFKESQRINHPGLCKSWCFAQSQFGIQSTQD